MSPTPAPSFHDPSGRFRWPEGVDAAAAFTFDLDAESAILSEAPSARLRLSVMTHQAYGPRTGLPRILRLLERKGIRATFFVPGYSAERHPAAVRAIRDAGHEIGHHGHLHEQVSALSPEAEEAALLRGLEALDRVAGIRPDGWRAPNWEMSYASPAILARHGFRYDSSLMDDDRPYVLEVNGHRMAELPPHWSLDDWEQYVYLPGLSGDGRIATPRGKRRGRSPPAPWRRPCAWRNSRRGGGRVWRPRRCRRSPCCRPARRSAASPLPRGVLAGARGRGRLVVARDGAPLRRLRRDRLPGAPRSGRLVGDAQRAVVLRLPRLRDGRARAGRRR